MNSFISDVPMQKYFGTSSRICNLRIGVVFVNNATDNEKKMQESCILAS